MNSNTSKTSCKRGFTLIELLVVVVIIGILAAVAVPQYQVAALKSQAARNIPSLNAMEMAQNVYHLEHGVYAVNKYDLDIQSDLVLGNGGDFSALGMVTVSDSLMLQWDWSIDQSRHLCIAVSSIARRVCQALGGTPIDHFHNSETKQYYKLPQNI